MVALHMFRFPLVCCVVSEPDLEHVVLGQLGERLEFVAEAHLHAPGRR